MLYRIFVNGQEVMRILTQRGKTQGWLAFRARISSSHMSNLMARRRAPSPEVAARIRDALRGASWDSIFKFQENSTGAAA